MRRLGQMASMGALVLTAACSGKPATGVECGTRLEGGHVAVIGSADKCQEVAGSIGPRVSEALVTGEMPENVQIVEEYKNEK